MLEGGVPIRECMGTTPSTKKESLQHPTEPCTRVAVREHRPPGPGGDTALGSGDPAEAQWLLSGAPGDPGMVLEAGPHDDPPHAEAWPSGGRQQCPRTGRPWDGFTRLRGEAAGAQHTAHVAGEDQLRTSPGSSKCLHRTPQNHAARTLHRSHPVLDSHGGTHGPGRRPAAPGLARPRPAGDPGGAAADGGSWGRADVTANVLGIYSVLTSCRPLLWRKVRLREASLLVRGRHGLCLWPPPTVLQAAAPTPRHVTAYPQSCRPQGHKRAPSIGSSAGCGPACVTTRDRVLPTPYECKRGTEEGGRHRQPGKKCTRVGGGGLPGSASSTAGPVQFAFRSARPP